MQASKPAPQPCAEPVHRACGGEVSAGSCSSCFRRGGDCAMTIQLFSGGGEYATNIFGRVGSVLTYLQASHLAGQPALRGWN